MKLSYQNDQVTVFDEVLAPGQRESLWTYLQLLDYRPLHHDRWHKDWGLGDGLPMRSAAVAFRSSGGEADGDASHYPTGTAIDAVIASVLDAQRQCRTVGRQGSEWERFRAAAYLYPAGSGLSWHHDQAESYSGSFIYYAHRVWNVAWGGELLVQPEPPEGAQALMNGTAIEATRSGGQLLDVKKVAIGPHLDNTNQDRLLSRHGRGEFILANPNRLVLIRAGVPHAVNPVNRAAGHHPRISVAGFFER
ncbi:MAG: 2OG-Fe(II) oxygenase [Myxococcota bacterium]